MRIVHQDRQLLGSSANLPDMWSNALLRQLTQSARQQARALQRTSGNRFRATRRTLALLLSRRRARRLLTFPQLEISVDTRVADPHTCTHKYKQADAALIKLPQQPQSRTRSRSTQNRKRHYHHEINHYHHCHHIVWLVTNDVRSRPDVAKTRYRRKAGGDGRSWQTNRRLSRPFHQGRARQSR